MIRIGPLRLLNLPNALGSLDHGFSTATLCLELDAAESASEAGEYTWTKIWSWLGRNRAALFRSGQLSQKHSFSLGEENTNIEKKSPNIRRDLFCDRFALS